MEDGIHLLSQRRGACRAFPEGGLFRLPHSAFPNSDFSALIPMSVRWFLDLWIWKSALPFWALVIPIFYLPTPRKCEGTFALSFLRTFRLPGSGHEVKLQRDTECHASDQGHDDEEDPAGTFPSELCDQQSK